MCEDNTMMDKYHKTHLTTMAIRLDCLSCSVQADCFTFRHLLRPSILYSLMLLLCRVAYLIVGLTWVDKCSSLKFMDRTLITLSSPAESIIYVHWYNSHLTDALHNHWIVVFKIH